MATKKQSVNQNFTMEDVLRAGYRIRPAPESTEAATPEPEPSRGTLRAVADVGLEAASGAAKGIKFMSDVFGASNPVSQGLQGVSDFAKELQSAQAKGEDQRIAQLMKEAEDKGVGEQVKAALRAAGEAPVRQAIGAIGTSVPMIAASMVPGLREASWGTRAAALGGMGGAQGVGVVKSQMYDSVYQRAIEEGRGEQDARALAQQAQAYSPENAGDIALGGVLGVGAALTGFEPAAARAVGGAVAKTAQRGLMQSTLRGTLTEALPEAIQGGQEQVAGNQAQQRAGFDTPTFRGVAGSATMEGVLSAPGGAVGGMLDARGAKPAPKLLADQIRATELVPESGPMTRAANQAVEARAQQVEMTAGAETAALAAMEKQAQDDLQGLRDFAGRSPEVVAGMPAAGAQPEAAGVEPTAEFIDSPFLDRIQTVQEMLADPMTRDKVRERWGVEGLNNIAYYAGMANRTGLPEKTQDNLLGMAERLLSESVLTPIQPASELGGVRRDPLTLGSQPQPQAPALGMDATPSGRFTVDPQGTAAPESRVQAMDAQRRAEEAATLGEQTPSGQAQTETTMQGISGIGMDTAPTGRLLAGQDGVRPETRMDAINIGQADMQRQAEAVRRAEMGLTPDIEAVQQRNAMRPLDGDILNPSGNPFKTKMAAQRAAKKNPGEIVEVTGGFVIRPAATMSTQQEVTGDERGNQAATAAAQGPADGVPAAADREMSAAEAGQGGVLDAVSGQPGATEPAQGDAQGAGEQPVTPLTAQPNVEVPAEAAPTPGPERGVPVAGAAGEPVEAAGVAQQAADTVSAVAGVERFDGAPAAEPTQQVDNQPAAEAAQPQPAAVTITADDVAAAEKQVAQQISDRIDGMKAQEAQKIAARYLPTIGVKVPIGKARIKAAMTDAAGVNLLGPAGELGIELSDSVKQALTAKREGRIGMPAAEPVATALPAAQATHQDPGASPEAVTKTVVNASMAKAARNEDAKPSEMRQWLLERIDQELQKAPDRPDYDALVKSMSEKDAVGMFTGSGPFGKAGETGYVSFDVPGDGTFKVRNSVRGLLEFRKRVEASPGFRDRGQQRARNEENQGVQRGSGGLVNAFNNMVEEGDLEAASDYADAVGLALDAKKVAGATKVLKWRESRDAAAEKASIDAAMNQSEVGQLAPARPDAGRRADEPQADVGQANANQPEPTPTPKAEAARPADDKPRLTDAGEELTRNRRNRITGISWADVEGMNDTLKVKTVTKANVWQKPNYEKLVEDGVPRWKVAILKAIYDKLAAKPDASRALTDDQMKRYIETMDKARDAVMAELDRVESSAAVKAAFESDEVKSFAAKGDDMVQAAAIMGLRGVLDGNRIMDAVFPKPEGAKLGRFDRTTEQGKDNNTNALLIGGNNALQAMQFNYKAVSKARDLLMEGFPAKQEAWSKSYNITPKDGRFFVIKKGYTFRRADNHPAEGFETQEQAQDFAREITKRGADKPLPPSRGLDLDSVTRTGPDWRKGKDVTSDEVKDAFGFRGVNLGEYVKANQKIAQLHLNSAYDALMDLSDLIGVPPKAISLNGTLGLAIGAQGSGRALAHFVPGVNEINITRDSGAGALAHEWAHALDHYFGVQDSARIAKSQEPFLTEHLSGKPDGVRPEVFEAFKAMVEVMKRKTMTQDEAREWLKGERVKAERALKFTIENMKAADQAAFDELGAKLMAGDVGNAGPDGVPENIAGFLNAAKSDITQQARLTMAAERVNALRDEVRFLNTHRPQARTNYAKASGALDAGKAKAYWSTNLEMFARAFESFVMDAMAERQRESLYLSGLSDGPMWKAWEKTSGQLSPFPKAEERLAINQAAQALVNAIETRETDKGMAMFSRRSASGNRLPDAIIGHKLGDLNKHPDYAAAKAGDDEAAMRIALDMVDDALVEKVRQAAGGADVIVPVVSVEASGRNKIPLMVAEVLADRLGSTAESQIAQANSPKRTAMDGLSRLLNPPVFDGPVQAGATYVLVDDTLTQGGTFAALASHINDGGGKVAAAVALTGKQYSAKLSPSPELLSQVRERFQSVEDQFRAATGYGFDALTESEARYLAKHDDAESVRARITEAGGQAIIGVGARSPSLSKGRRSGLSGLTSAEAKSIADAIAKRWANAPEIVVAADMNDATIPQEVRDYDAKQRSLGAEGEPEGFWYGGKVYLVADAIRSPSDVMRVLFHESLGHYGLRGVFGKALDPILNQIAALRRADVQAKADEYGLDLENPKQRLQAAEEVLAVMAQTKPELGYVKRAISQIRSWLRRTFPKLFGQLKLTDAEIIRDYILPARGWVERGPGGGPKGGLPAMSRSQEQASGDAPIRFSRTASAKAYIAPAMDKLNETFNHPGKLSWWHKTVGSMYNLAERMPAFKPVYDAAQSFINDVSFYAIEAADKAPRLLPRLEEWRDLAKSPITAQDNKAVAAPVFEGTLSWRRDESGKPVLVEDLAKRYASLTPEQKAQRLLRANAIGENVLKMWQGMPQAQYESSVNTAFEGRMLKAGIVFTPDELKSIFKLNDAQVALYQEFRQSIDASLDNMGKSDLLRVAGKDATDLKDAVMTAPDVDAAAVLLRDHLLDLAKEDPDRRDELTTTANDMITRAEKVQRLKMEGYAPLSRFGQYTVDVVVDGERQYFSMFETARDANRMAAKLKMEYGAENVAQGTLSQREFEMLQGITPETLELFGNMLGLDSTGNQAQDQVFQEYLKRTKANRSAMKRLIHRKGIAGYSEDVGRVLAAFVYSNARQTSAALHMGDLGEAVMAIPKGEGELKDAAVELARYVKEPREEAAKMRGWLFAQYLGGSIASAIVNFTQPLTTSAPYLSQFGGMGKSVKALYQAMADLKDKKFEAGLAESFRKRTEDGTLAPQGVHELMAQSRGEATLRTGDGTQVGDALAKGRNALSKVMIGWGKLFGIAEQINRQSTYVAAYRMGVERGMADPDAFAKKVVDETQFVNNKANKMKFGRGAIGATLMTFKSYSLNWLELFHRLATQNGREGKMAAAWMVGVLLLSAGASGLPFAEDAEDLADFLAQRLGYNWSSKKARQEFLESLFGRDIAGLVENGVTGLPGAPIDVSGRLGMGNLIPGTGLLLKKKDHTSDFTEVLGPAGDLAKRTFQAGDLLLSGNVKEAALTIAPKAIGNLEKGVDMAATGLYRDARGYKVDDATTGEAIGKAIGFQPRSIAQIQEASGLNQRAKDFYRLKVEGINAKWAKAIFEKDSAAVDEVRAELKRWNRQNPDQRIQANIPAILRRVKEMRKPKADRIADTAPKAMRASMREEARRMQEEMR